MNYSINLAYNPGLQPGLKFNISLLGNNSNNSSELKSETGRDEGLARVEIAIQAVLFSLAVLSNTIVLIVLTCRKRKLSRMNLLIVYLSLADIFVALFNVLPQLLWDVTFYFYANDFVCRGVKYLQVVGLYASSYILLATACDRYIALCHPITSHTWSTGRVHFMAAVSWAAAMLFAVPQVAIFSLVEVSPGRYNCWATFEPEWTLQAYITWFTVAIYIVPTLFLVVAYGRICYVVWRSGRHHASPQVRLITMQGSSTGLSRSKVKTVKLTLAVIVCYFVCWSPFFISQMWAAWDHNAPFQGTAMTIILLLASLNSCTNPWIYLIFMDSAHMCPCCRSSPPNQHRQHPRRTTTTWTSSYRTTTASTRITATDCSPTMAARLRYGSTCGSEFIAMDVHNRNYIHSQNGHANQEQYV